LKGDGGGQRLLLVLVLVVRGIPPVSPREEVQGAVLGMIWFLVEEGPNAF
jgi:hypothetical protein